MNWMTSHLLNAEMRGVPPGAFGHQWQPAKFTGDICLAYYNGEFRWVDRSTETLGELTQWEDFHRLEADNLEAAKAALLTILRLRGDCDG